MRNTISFRSAILPFSVAAVLSLTACGAEDAKNAADTPAATSAAAESGDEQGGEGQVNFDGAWVKATEEDMTAIFGTLENPTDADIELESAEVDVDAKAELHEVVQDAGSSVMRQVDGGLSIPAGGELRLDPGGFHIMLVDLGEAIAPGQNIELTMHFSDGTESTTTVPARAFEGAQEEYHAGGGEGNEGDEGGAGGAGMDMDHGSMDHGAGSDMDMDHGSMGHGNAEGHDH